MKVRGTLLIGAVMGAGMLGAMAACSAPDPGAISYSVRPGASGEPQGSSTSSSGAPGDAAVEAAPPPDPIFGTEPFKYVDPGVVANTANPAHAGTVEGKNCMTATTCHGPDGPKPWVFAGTLYSSVAGTTTVAKGQIRVLGPDGAEIGTTYTDANGNFWLDKAAATVPAGSTVGVRKEGGTAPRQMASKLQTTDNGCNKGGTCHVGQTPKVYAD
jgi:hypothetical protein